MVGVGEQREGQTFLVPELGQPGRLVRVPRGSGGFGYDPIFLPSGFEQTTAEMTAETKDAISHRGRAFRALTPFIMRLRNGA